MQRGAVLGAVLSRMQRAEGGSFGGGAAQRAAGPRGGAAGVGGGRRRRAAHHGRQHVGDERAEPGLARPPLQLPLRAERQNTIM